MVEEEIIRLLSDILEEQKFQTRLLQKLLEAHVWRSPNKTEIDKEPESFSPEDEGEEAEPEQGSLFETSSEDGDEF